MWDWNRFTKSEFLGEVMIPLKIIDLNDTSTRCYSLEAVSVRLSVRLSVLYNELDQTTVNISIDHLYMCVYSIKRVCIYTTESVMECRRVPGDCCK